MKPILNLLLLCILHTGLYAQQSSSTNEKYPFRYWALKIGTGELIPYNPMVQFSLERRMNKIAVQAGFGFCIPTSYVVDGVSGKADGYTVRLEGRWYAFQNKRKPALAAYIGCEAYYKEYKRPLAGYFERNDTSIDPRDRNYTDNYVLHKSMYGVAGKAGFELRFLRHFLFDVSLGLGVKKVSTTHSERKYPNDEEAWVLKESMLFIVPETGTHVGEKLDPAIPFNISLGYFFH